MRRLTLMLVATMALGGSGLLALACSSDPAQIPGGDDDDDDDATSSSGKNGSSGNGSSGNGSSGNGSSGTTTSSSGGSSGANKPCDETKVKLRPTPDEGIYCPFQNLSDGGLAFDSCDIGEKCCRGKSKGENAGFYPTECRAECIAEQHTEYACGEASDCATGEICCLLPNPNGTGTIATDYSWNTTEHGTCPAANGVYGSACRATACGEREVQGCQTNEECPTGKSCSVRKVGAGMQLQIGVCE